MSLFAIVALSLAGVGVYIAYNNPKLGAAILVGVAIITLLWLIGNPSEVQSQPGPGASSPTSPAEPAQSPTSAPATPTSTTPGSAAAPEPDPPGSSTSAPSS
jgi:hypothetical protein